jgi:uncharacterized LabA/DUF88 family protein
MTIEVKVESKVIDTTEENLKHDTEAQTFQKESWPVRREVFKEQREGEFGINKLSVKNWLNTIEHIQEDKKTLMVLVDGTFAHSAAVYFAKKYIDYRKFREAIFPYAKTLHYFSANQDQDSITRFLHYISSIEGCEVIVKNLPRSTETNINKSVYKSVAVDMTIIALREAYDNPDIQQALILSRDPELIPTIKELKDLDIKVTLARCKDIATSRYLLQEATVTLDIYDLFETLSIYSDTQIKKHEEQDEKS